jgi:hypothetical protein
VGSCCSAAFAQNVAPLPPPAARPVPPPPPPSDEAAGTAFNDGLVLDTGRTAVTPAEPGTLRFQVHGQYQARLTGLSNLPLEPYENNPATASLGQTARLYHWLRITPRLQIGKSLEVIGQIDVPRGFILGQDTRDVGAAREPLNETQPLKVAPRWLYVNWMTPIGLFRVGQQPSDWGMGILANDGDHPTLFGDYRGGSIVERVLYATRPAGRDSPFNVAVAGDLVFKDPNADLTNDDVAWQGVLAAFYENKHQDMVGVYGVYRDQHRDAAGVGTPFTERTRVGVVDSAGKFNAKIPGGTGHVFGSYEVAYVFGKTSYVRTLSETVNNQEESVSQLGAAARLGAVTTSGQGDHRWGSFVASIEWGWASGDADPNDGTQRRFTFDPNHNVGLILFNEALAWKTARAATIAEDPALSARPMPGTDLLPSNGGIFGATYLYPTVVVRPMPQLDLKAGAVIAQTTADFVDPVALGVQGRFQNYDGGNPLGHGLGLELDAGFEYRLALDYNMTLQLGAEGGVFFPGDAFANQAGDLMANQYIGVGRLGLQY